MPVVADRIYVPKTYSVHADRTAVVEVIEDAIVASGARLIYSSFRSEAIAPMYFGAEDHAGHRYGLLVYPFTTRDARPATDQEANAEPRFDSAIPRVNETSRIRWLVTRPELTSRLCCASIPKNASSSGSIH